MKMRRPGVSIAVLFCVSSTLAAGCGAEDTSEESGPAINCTAAEYYDHVEDRCIPKQRMNRQDTGVAASGEDADDDPEPAPDTGTRERKFDTGSQSMMCDKDNDRSKAKACGGNDCDDNDPRKSPDMAERCDSIDNDCSGEINDGIDCSFYAHEGRTLYKINPLQKKAREVGADLPGLHDIDTHPDGTLYGVSPDGFYKFRPEQKDWQQLREFPTDASWAPDDPNGMAINRQGKIFVTSNATLFSITKKERDGQKQWWVEEVGSMGQTSSGAEYKSSGDAVVNKRTLYMTSKHAESEDHLVTLTPTSGKASDAKPIGYEQVFGLTTAWGELYGLTKNGELIEINPRTGESTLVHTFDHQWSGAASTPRRDDGGSPPAK